MGPGMGRACLGDSTAWLACRHKTGPTAATGGGGVDWEATGKRLVLWAGGTFKTKEGGLGGHIRDLRRYGEWGKDKSCGGLPEDPLLIEQMDIDGLILKVGTFGREGHM